MRFFVGLHKPWQAKHFAQAFISVNRIRDRKRKPLGCSWIMDSGAFTELVNHGRYRHSVEDYAREIERVRAFDPGLICAVAQDYMCEPFILARTGLTVAQHQALTIERYMALRELSAVTIMPVLQGYAVTDYVRHIELYGSLLAPNAWVGVGSVCKRNTNPVVVEHILFDIKRRRPDLRLHGFGLKKTALSSAGVRELLHSADSMAWSYAARREGRNRNCWREAMRFVDMIDTQPLQYSMVPAWVPGG